jgi:hypothetical protein
LFLFSAAPYDIANFLFLFSAAPYNIANILFSAAPYDIANFLFLFSAAPYDIAINPVQVDVIVGSAFSAKCTAKGDPAPTFSWYFGDRMIQTGPDLSITASTSTDDGLYTCVATNTLGMQQATMDANVRCTY